MQKQKLIQTHHGILRFWGDELYNASTKKDRDDERWKVVRIFRSKRSYVLGIARMTTFKLEERNLFAACEARNKEEIVALIHEAVPELTKDVAEALRLRSIDEERLRKELEKWKKRTPIKDQELLLLDGKEEERPSNGWSQNEKTA